MRLGYPFEGNLWKLESQYFQNIVVASALMHRHFSGAAWATTKDQDVINVITSWDSEYNQCSDRQKCPTLLQYGDINETTPWGYNISPDKDEIRWFKLLLLDKKDVPKDISQCSQLKEAEKRMRRLRKDPVELVACYLSSLWSFCTARITRALGAGEVGSCKIRIVMTIPAIWPHYAQDRMKRAAELAGMLQTTSVLLRAPTLEFASEPEAAALAVLAGFSPRPDIQEGDTIVDLITYQITSPKTFQLRECVVGEGGLCGGIFVDHHFENLIAEKLGDSSWLNLDFEDRRAFMKEKWETGIKSQFSGNDRVFRPEVPDGYVSGGATGKRKRLMKITLERSDLCKVFDPVVDKCCGLVQRQINATQEQNLPYPKFIILVGGFGCCQYLFNKLTELHPNTTILNPPTDQAWAAVCRGAVRHALTSRNRAKRVTQKGSASGANDDHFVVQSRIARVSLGFNFQALWDSKVHEEEDYIWDDDMGVARAANQMIYIVKKGDSVDVASSSTYYFTRTFTNEHDTSVEEELFYTTLDEPPSRMTVDVKKLCVIKWKQRVDLRKLKLAYNEEGGAYHVLRYRIQVKIDAANLKIDVYHGPKKVGDGELRIEYTV
ncbi:hypothetical protein V2A60_005160 [Cordyceps javanica]